MSSYLVATHLHDSLGQSDDDLLPFDGTIDWASALTTIRKVGYDGVVMFDLAARGTARTILEQARPARTQMERLLAP